MAYNFLGTIKSREQFEEFSEFITIEINQAQSRINHLMKEQNRVYELLDRFKSSDARLRGKYSLSKDVSADWLVAARPYVSETPATIDNLNAVDVEKLKKPFVDVIKSKRERNEFKIKKLLDLAEQIQTEINVIQGIQENYKDLLEKVNARFDMPDFVESQSVSNDPADDIPGLRAQDKNAGVELNSDGSIAYYLPVWINGTNNTVYFEGQIPPVVPGDVLLFSNGKNNGLKTVKKLINSQTIQLSESLVSELTTKTRITYG